MLSSLKIKALKTWIREVVQEEQVDTIDRNDESAIDDSQKIIKRFYCMMRKKEWLRAMHEEMKSLHKNNTYELMELPKAFLHSDLEEEIYMEQPEGFYNQKQGTLSVSTEEELVWSQVGTETVVQEV
ncbi:hypothetical protein CK203_079472 [Vitis vinifera]|uniref:Uncharacterized protein n=1 Tax=Vitis vinifera TaxID=29760 RepID=A0A438CNV5_VITVI|nr:hypothetical protein CK203_079472 [Vitis vinifera]